MAEPKYIELIDKYLIKQGEGDYNPPSYEWVDNTGEIVRCKDCKHRYVSGYTTQYYVCDFMDAELKDEGYCSYGERKDG